MLIKDIVALSQDVQSSLQQASEQIAKEGCRGEIKSVREDFNEQHDRFTLWARGTEDYHADERYLSLELRASNSLRQSAGSLLQVLKWNCGMLISTALGQTPNLADDPLIERNDGTDFQSEASSSAPSGSSSDSIDPETLVENLTTSMDCLLRLAKTFLEQHQLPSQKTFRKTEHSTQVFDEATEQWIAESHIRFTLPSLKDHLRERLAKSIVQRRILVHQFAPQLSAHAMNDETPKELFNQVTKIFSRSRPTIATESGDISSSDEDESDSNHSGVTTTKPCPLCSVEVNTDDSDSKLRAHIREELEPYVCLEPDCPTAAKTYPSRSSWLEHVKLSHGAHWRCCFDCPRMFASRTAFLRHLQTDHTDQANATDLDILIEMCEKHVLPRVPSSCPLCEEIVLNHDGFYRHVENHFDTMALSCLEPAKDQTIEYPTHDLRSKGSVGDNESVFGDTRSIWSAPGPSSTAATSVGFEAERFPPDDPQSGRLITSNPLESASKTEPEDLASQTDKPAGPTKSSPTKQPGETKMFEHGEKELKLAPHTRKQRMDTTPPYEDPMPRTSPKLSMPSPKASKSSPRLGNFRPMTPAFVEDYDSDESLAIPGTRVQARKRSASSQPPPIAPNPPSEASYQQSVARDSGHSSVNAGPPYVPLYTPIAERRYTVPRLHKGVPEYSSDRRDRASDTDTGQRPLRKRRTEGEYGDAGLGSRTLVPPSLPKVLPLSSNDGVEPSCAICGAPANPECPHESERLELALNQAMQRWSGYGTVRNWVIDWARGEIIDKFRALREVRLKAHRDYLKNLPFYTLYYRYGGKPPVAPNRLQTLKAQIRQANVVLQQGVDADWRTACLHYPESLDYFFGVLRIAYPRQEDLVIRNTTVPHSYSSSGASNIDRPGSRASNWSSKRPSASRADRSSKATRTKRYSVGSDRATIGFDDDDTRTPSSSDLSAISEGE